MQTKLWYCPRCNHEVRLVMTVAPLHGGQATLPDAPEVICVECGESCAGEVCPLTNMSHVVMEHRKEQIEQLP